MSGQPSIEKAAAAETELLDRRLFLRSLGKWSGAAVVAAVGGVWIFSSPEARAGIWINRRGPIRGGGWINRGGGGWVNRGGWINRGGGWINRRDWGGGGWINRW